jgi:predicted RecB family nuclease
MYREDGTLVISASDLVGFSACSHLTWLDLQVANGKLPNPRRKKKDTDAEEDTPDLMLQLLIERGLQHEREYRESLEQQGLNVISLDDSEASPRGRKQLADIRAKAAATTDALLKRAGIVFQGTFLNESKSINWLGYADFIKPVNDEFGENLEPEDTKLAGHVSVNAVIQLCNYVDHIERVTGKRPRKLRVVLGRGAPAEEFVVDQLFAYYEFLKQRFVAVLESPVETYPLPVSHCGVCKWSQKCEKRWVDDDHLSLVAFMTTTQMKRLEAAGITDVATLAATDQTRRIPNIAPEVLTRLIEQADLQKRSKNKPVPEWKLVLPATTGLGLAPLPKPNEGDVFYDIEGHPYFGNNGLEYLHGIATVEKGIFAFRGEWAHSPTEERRVFEELVDFLMARWKQFPGMHVYHYAAYETTALTRLMGQYGTREREIDAMLRGNLFVDLYRVVRQGVRVGVRSYSIKRLEPLYMKPREGQIVMASSSVIEYERWLRTRDPQILKDIETYNMEDVKSTWLLRGWLEERRAEVEKDQGSIPRTPPITPDSAERDNPELRLLISQLNADRSTVVSQ